MAISPHLADIATYIIFIGNNRCSLAGVDLNRRWINPDINLHPEVYYTKSLIENFN